MQYLKKEETLINLGLIARGENAPRLVHRGEGGHHAMIVLLYYYNASGTRVLG